jgi:predicted nucleic acid-binding protein
MSGAVLLDTGPLVAFLAADSIHSAWARDQWERTTPPMLTCEPVLTEAAFILKREGADPDAIFTLLERKVLRIGIRVEDELPDLRALMRRYRNRPMSLADACLVRMAELHDGAKVFTLDSDFRIYRRHGNKAIPLLAPEA